MENQPDMKTRDVHAASDMSTRMGAGAIIALIMQILSDPTVQKIIFQVLEAIVGLIKNKKPTNPEV
jgi:hypothetical protein